jgi:IPT/TIG domain
MPVTANITSINPTTGTVGTTVQLNGMNFVQGGLHGVVIFTNNKNATTVLSYTNTTIVVAVPAGSVSGNVFIEYPGGNSNSVAFNVTAPSTPTIISLTPSNGGTGIPVTIAGTNFGASQGSSFVTFNGIVAMVTKWSATSIVAVVPSTATTGPVIVTVAGVASNSETFTVTSPSIGGTATPLGFTLFPFTQFTTPVLFVFDITNYNELSNGSIYSYKVEEILQGRTPSCTRQVITYRDLGVCSVTAALTGYNQNVSADAPLITNQETFTIGTAAATGKLNTIVRGLTLTGQNLQYVLERPPAGGPMSIVKVRLEGRVELTPYA